MEKTQKILVIKLGAFGDVIMGEGALRDIRAFHRDAEITVLTTPPYRRIMERCPSIDRVMIDPRAPRWKFTKLIKLRAALREQNFDRVYDLQNSSRTAMYFRWMSGTNPDLAWSGTAKGCSHPHHAQQPKKIPGLDRLAGQLADAGVPVINTLTPDVSWMADDVQALMAAHRVKPGFILLIAGASARHPQKRWPYFAELAEALHQKGYQTVTAPGPDEMDLCSALSSVMLLDDGKPLNFFQLAGLVKHAGYVVTNDTGPGHLAAHGGAAAGLALFGAHTPAIRTCIDRRFDVLETRNLADLNVDSVMGRILQGLKNAD